MSRYTLVDEEDIDYLRCTAGDADHDVTATVLVDAEPIASYRGEALCAEHYVAVLAAEAES